MFVTGTFQCTVIATKEDCDSGYVDVCRVLTADKSGQKDPAPPGVISRQSPVHNIALPEDHKCTSGLDIVDMTA